MILTPTSEGVKVNSDNMQDARVTVNGDGTFASKAINTTKNEILVQEDEDATVGDCIRFKELIQSGHQLAYMGQYPRRVM